MEREFLGVRLDVEEPIVMILFNLSVVRIGGFTGRFE
jgi:hypothetical protein